MMSGVDISQDALGQDIETYPESHQVYNSMGLTSKKLEEEDGMIYSSGLFTFQKKMDITKYKPECFDIEVDPNTSLTATILQILFAEMIDEKPFSSPIVKKRGGGLKFSKSSMKSSSAAAAGGKRSSPAGKSPNTRSASKKRRSY